MPVPTGFEAGAPPLQEVRPGETDLRGGHHQVQMGPYGDRRRQGRWDSEQEPRPGTPARARAPGARGRSDFVRISGRRGAGAGRNQARRYHPGRVAQAVGGGERGHPRRDCRADR
jgi:hypothetical protein